MHDPIVYKNTYYIPGHLFSLTGYPSIPLWSAPSPPCTEGSSPLQSKYVYLSHSWSEYKFS